MDKLESYVNSQGEAQDDVTLKHAPINLQAVADEAVPAEPVAEQSRLSKIAAKVEEALISYGYDQAAVD